MSTPKETGDGTLGCGGVLVIIVIAVVLIGAMGSMGKSQQDEWCPPDHWACREEK